jgi:hypothetical protein
MNPDFSPQIDTSAQVVVPQAETLDTSSAPAIADPAKKKRRTWLSVFGLLIGLLIIILAVIINRLQNYKPEATDDNHYTLTSVSLSDLGADFSSALGQIGQLDVNGYMQVNGSIVIAPTTAPTNPIAGQIYVDNQTNQLYFYDGNQYQLLISTGNAAATIDIFESDPIWSAASSNYFNLNQNELITGIPAFNGGTTGLTAPFSVDSTHLVTNLNADYLDGLSSSGYLRNQNALAQAADFWIDGSGIAETSLLTPSLDVASAGTLSLGATTATAINVATGASTAVIFLGGGNGTLAINTTNWDVASNGAASGFTSLSSSGTITFSSLNTAGVVTNTAAGILGTATSLGVNLGGTGATTLTPYGILYGNGVGAIGATAAGTTGQCLMGNTGSFPAWDACPGGGVGTSFTLTGSSGVSQVINDGDTATIAQGANITTVASATDTVTISVVDSPSFSGLTSSGTITFSGLNTAGVVTNTAAGVLGTTATLGVGLGGTGAATFNAYGVLYGNGVGALGSTVGGSLDQCLVSTGGASAPSWGDCNGSGSGNYIQNQYVSQQTASYWISGIARADTNVLSPTIMGSPSANGTLTVQGNNAAGGNTATNSNLVFKVGDSGGVTAMTILNNANVGIGDTTPDQKLEVLDSGAANTQITISNTNVGDYDSQIGFEVVDGVNTFTLGIDDSDGDKFKISTTALGTDDRLIIDSSGNVGIGDTSPASLLTVGSGDLFQVSSGGAITAATGITSSGIITFSGLNTVGIVTNTAAGVLGTTAGTTGQCLFGNTGAAPSWGSCAGAGITYYSLAGSSGTPQSINGGDTATIAQGTNITTVAGATDTITVSVVNAPTFSGLVTGQLGLTVTGAAISLNASSNFDTNINTGTSTGAINIGNTAAGAITMVSGVTTGTTTTSALSLSANSLTSGTGLYLASSTLTSGKLLDIQVSGTAAAASQTALNILATGATATNAITTYGGYISNTHTNATSGTNIGLYLNASGATTANYGLIVDGGNVGIGDTSPLSLLTVGSGDLFQVDSSGNITTAADLYLNGGDLKTTSATITLQANNADEAILGASAFYPAVSDGNALGTGSYMWSDLFLASGSVVNFNNGDVTLTHSADLLTIAGGNLSVPDLTVSGTLWGNAGSLTVGESTVYMAESAAADGETTFSTPADYGFTLMGDRDADGNSGYDPILSLKTEGSATAVFKVDQAGRVYYSSAYGSSSTYICNNSGYLAACSSSIRYKTNVQDLSDGLEAIRQFRPVTFDWIQSGDHDFGLIAEEVQQINPLFTFNNADGQVEGVRYAALVGVLANGVQELDVQQQSIIQQLNSQLFGFSANNLTIKDTATINELVVSNDAVINGKLTVAGNAQFNNLEVKEVAIIQALKVKDVTVSGNLVVKGYTQVADIIVNGHIISAGDTPTIAAGLAAGEGAITEVLGNDTSGTITITTGINTLANNLVEVIFSNPFNKQPKVILTAGDANTANLNIYRSASSSKFTISLTQPPQENTSYSFDYLVIE